MRERGLPVSKERLADFVGPAFPGNDDLTVELLSNCMNSRFIRYQGTILFGSASERHGRARGVVRSINPNASLLAKTVSRNRAGFSFVLVAFLRSRTAPRIC